MFKILKKGDFVLFFVLILLGISVFSFTYLSSSEGKTAVVRLNGEVYGNYSLDKDKKVTIRQKNGYVNEFTIKDGHVQMTYANCGNQVCVRTGTIEKTGQQIVCLPHRLTITITGGDDGYDGLS
ncbi:MAG: NusG domain II-containing protein [Eubacteriales bacterium]|nr:NusG domain II-containing protein [Eubacteriales bacterium]